MQGTPRNDGREQRIAVEEQTVTMSIRDQAKFYHANTHAGICVLTPRRDPLAAATAGSALHSLALSNGHCGLVVDCRCAHALLDLTGHGQESLFDICGALCRGLEEGNTEAVCELLYGVVSRFFRTRVV